MIVRQSRWVDRGEKSIDSDSSNQSSADALASSAPYNSATAAMNADNSRSANEIWPVHDELVNDSLCFMMSFSPRH